ncbi:phosphoribosyltransferase [Pseudoruegeria sp. HB172150]|uniref:phosphoribosyltransferase n=1 Tax=Pseudoruegeria sp. HB172150 TaxID=2721164 RepID=UPI001554502B|nr:phosphoribosyltransferase [Pseudoruegeria sp. HB172150]
MQRFRNRTDAGETLAERVAALGLADPVVLALPRGGVPVAAPVAKKLNAPLDLILVRKIGAPGNPEFAAGAVADGPKPQVVWNDSVLNGLGIGEDDLQETYEHELETLKTRREIYLKGRARVPLAGRDVVVVDDGIATGATLRAALQAVSVQGPRQVVLAVPIAPQDAEPRFAQMVDRFVCLSTPAVFYAVGQGYDDFAQTSDAEVIACLDANRN